MGAATVGNAPCCRGAPAAGLAPLSWQTCPGQPPPGGGSRRPWTRGGQCPAPAAATNRGGRGGSRTGWENVRRGAVGGDWLAEGTSYAKALHATATRSVAPCWPGPNRWPPRHVARAPISSLACAARRPHLALAADGQQLRHLALQRLVVAGLPLLKAGERASKGSSSVRHGWHVAAARSCIHWSNSRPRGMQAAS